MPTVTHYLWHRDSVALEADESNTIRSRNVRFPDQYGSLVSQQTSSTTHIFHYDAVGSTNELTDSQQQVTNSIRYSAFGEIVQQTSSLSVTATWIGQSGYESSGLGLYYVRNRHYSANSSRWQSPDPLGLSDDTNLYAYVANSPLQYIDPSGLERLILCKDGSVQRVPDGTPERLWCAGRGGPKIVPPKPHKPCVERFASGETAGSWCFTGNKLSDIRTWGESVPGKGFWNTSAWATFTATGSVSLQDQVICCCPERRVGIRFVADYEIDVTLRLYQRKDIAKALVTPKKIKQILHLKKLLKVGQVLTGKLLLDEMEKRFGNLIKKACKTPIDSVVLEVKDDLLKFSINIPPGAKPTNNPAHRVDNIFTTDGKYHLGSFKPGDYCS